MKSSALFQGADVSARDNERLLTQLDRIKAVIADNGWYTVQQIATATGDPETSISAQLRNLRKAVHGKLNIERKREQNLSYYRLAPAA